MQMHEVSPLFIYDRVTFFNIVAWYNKAKYHQR